MACLAKLPNIGVGSCPLAIGEIKRIGFTSTFKEDGTQNKITLTAAGTSVAWKTLFEKKHFAADVLTKVVVTPIVYEGVSQQAEPEAFDQGGYYKELRDGDYDIMVALNEVPPYVLKQLNELERADVSVYLFDDNAQVLGIKSGSDLLPIAGRLSVPNFNLPSYNAISQAMLKFRVKSPKDVNSLWVVPIASARINDPDTFYSLRNVVGTVAAPALTGFTMQLTEESTGLAFTGLTFDKIALVPTDGSATRTLAASTSLTYNAGTNTYTINEAALLTSGKTYKVQISVDKFDFVVADVVVS
jgi:hypothetical protein